MSFGFVSNMLRKRLLQSPLLILLMLGCAERAALAAAPSFDCTKATATVDRLICSNEFLSSLDATLADVYLKRRQRLAGDERSAFIAEQKSWLKKRDNVCGIDSKNTSIATNNNDQIIGCFAAVYQDRIVSIKNIDIPRYDLPKDFDSAHISLLYSADDALCRPLGKLYDELSHASGHEKPNTAGIFTHWIWEDSYPDKFSSIGLRLPPYIKDEMHPNGNYRPSVEKHSNYYMVKINKNSTNRIVLVDDEDAGGHGDINTNIFVFNEGASVGLNPFDNNTIGDISFGITAGKHFNGRIKGISFPYNFNRYNISTRFSWVDPSSIINGSARVLDKDIGIGRGPGLIQRIYLFDGDVFFTAREGGHAIVYKIRDDNTVEDICYYAGNVIEVSHGEKK